MLEEFLGKTDYETRVREGENAFRYRYAYLRRRSRLAAVWKTLLAILIRF